MTILDTRTEAERRYDAERDGSLYLRPAQAEAPAAAPIADPIAALRAQIDAAEDYDTKRRLIFRLFDLALATPPAPAPAIRVEHLINDDTADPARLGTEMGIDYHCGDGMTGVTIGVSADDMPGFELLIGNKSLYIHKDAITVADIRQLRDNLTALLSDPRVLAALAPEEPSAPQRKAA